MNPKALRPLRLAAAMLALTPCAFSPATQSCSTLTVLGTPSEDVITILFDVTPGDARVFGLTSTPDGVLFTDVSKLVANTLASSDIVNVQILSAMPPELDLNTGDGDSQVLVDIQTPFGLMPTYSEAVVRGGAQKDSVLFELTDNAFGGTYDYTVFGGEGDDVIEVITSSSMQASPPISGGLGSDVLLISIGQNLLAGSNQRIPAGEGNVTVSMLVGAAALGSPFSDGCPGNESFTGVGTAVNFE